MSGAPAGGRVFADPSVDRLAEQVGVSGVPAVLFDQVADHAAQAGVLNPRRRGVDELVEAAVGQSGVEPGAGPGDGAVLQRVELFGRVVGGRGELPVVLPSQPRASHGAPDRLAAELRGEVVVLDRARCLSSPPRVSVDGPSRAFSPAASRPSAFQRNVVRSRSSAPRSCSASVPASGGSHGVSLSVMAPP